MIDKIINEGGINTVFNEDSQGQIKKNSPEFFEIQFHFNTIFNDYSSRQSSDQKLFEIDKAYSLRNQFVSINFEKREENEVSSYGWYTTGVNDPKKTDEIIYKYKNKGLEKIDQDINVSPYINNGDESQKDVFLCKFLIGETYITFEDDNKKYDIPEINQEFLEKYDTIVKVSKDNKITRYQVLKLENIELLYLLKIKTADIEPKIIQCSSPNCKLNEPGVDQNTQQNKSMYFCNLTDKYLCYNCHLNAHSEQVYLSNFNTSNCEQITLPNLPGECENPLNHENNEKCDFFCKTCNRGICSYCRFYGTEKHGSLEVISTLFAASRPIELEKENKEFYLINDKFTKFTKELSSKISEVQKSNSETSTKLMKEVVQNQFQNMFKELDGKLLGEGERLLRISYQLNFLKDMILRYHKLYKNKETILKDNNLSQELFWTKKMHFDHMLFLIELKDKISTDYSVKEEEFDEIIEGHEQKINEKIREAFGLHEMKEKEIEKENDKITVNNVLEEAKIEDKNLYRGSSIFKN